MRGIATACAGMLFASIAEPCGATLGEAPLSVEGALRIHATRSDDVVMIQVEDEAGHPVAGAEVSIQGVEATPCDQPKRNDPHATSITCFRIGSTQVQPVFVLATKAHFSPARTELDVPNEKISPALLVWPRRVDLDRDERHTVELGPIPDGLVHLILTCGQEAHELYRERRRASAHLRLEFPTSSFQRGLGLCELTGSAAGFAISSAPVTIHATARLSLQRVAALASHRIEVLVDVQTRFGPADMGVVEASSTDMPRRTASVRNGRARFEFTAAESGLPISVNYLSPTPAITAGPPLKITLPRLEATQTSRLWLSLPLFFLAGWLLLRFRRSAHVRRPTIRSEKKGTPQLSPSQAERDLHGVVFDVDTHERVEGAVVALHRIEATQRTLIFRTQSGLDGTFSIPHIWRGQVDWEITCSAPQYSEERTRPEGSFVRIGVVAERRALLRSLIRWVQASGWWKRGASPLPTPLDVAIRARSEGRSEIETWARQVNVRVYGSGAPEIDLDHVLAEPPPVDALR